MLVTHETIRRRLEALSTEELRHVLDAADGQYTPEAIEIARDILACRPKDASATQVRGESIPPESKRDVWGTITALGAAGQLVRFAIDAWRMSEEKPEVFWQVVQDLVSSPWTYFVVLAGAIWLRRRRT